MSEDFDLHEFATRATDVVVADELSDFRHLAQGQFTGGDDDVGEASIVAHSLDVGDVALGRDMHLDTYLICVGDNGHIGSDDGTDAGFFSGMQQGVHLLNLVVVNDGVDGEVGAHAYSVRHRANASQVVDSEVGRRTGAHI